MSIDFLVLATVRFTMLPVLVFLSIERRRVIHFGVTARPAADWTAQQVVEAFPWYTAPKCLFRYRDPIYGSWSRSREKNMEINEVLTVYHSRWQNPYSERLNGRIRRKCLDHVMILTERHLRRILTNCVEYYNRLRVHLTLDMDAPEDRIVHALQEGKVFVFAIPRAGGLRHHYVRKAA